MIISSECRLFKKFLSQVKPAAARLDWHALNINKRKEIKKFLQGLEMRREWKPPNRKEKETEKSREEKEKEGARKRENRKLATRYSWKKWKEVEIKRK